MADSSKLFTPLKVGRCSLQHRCVLSPMSRNRADILSVPFTSVKEYYTQRACVPGTLLITEATFISPQSKGYANCPGIWSSEQIQTWKEIVASVHSKGSYIWMQLWATGRMVDDIEVLTSKGFDLVSSSAVPIPPSQDDDIDRSNNKPRALTEAEIEIYLQDYVQAAKNAILLAGFDGVEIHGANGFLPDQFFQSCCNQRTDRWGGSMENRARFGLEITKRVVDAVGADRVAMKLSPWSQLYGMGISDDLKPQFEFIISSLRKMNIAYLHLSNSFSTVEEKARPDNRNEAFVRLWGKTIPIFLAGGYSLESAKLAVDEVYSEHSNVAIAFAQSYISNPDLPFRLKYGIPLLPHDPDAIYTATPERKGYSDYPFCKEFMSSQQGTVLVLGGRGKTASLIASLLHASSIPFLVASRSMSPDSPHKQAIFDWLDERTYENIWLKISEEGLKRLSTVWLVSPPTFDTAASMISFVKFAFSMGVKKFILLSASTIEKGGPAMGQVHEYLDSLDTVEYVVLRPTWFMDNFSNPDEWQLPSIKNYNRIYSAAGNGKIPFISALDIARVAVRFLTDVVLPCKDYILLGPELLSYDQVAYVLTQVLGRKITHVNLTGSQLSELLVAHGMSPGDSEMLAAMDQDVKNGGEEKMNHVVGDLTGGPAESFQDFANRVKVCWN